MRAPSQSLVIYLTPLMSQEPPPQPPFGYYPAPQPKSGINTGAKIALGVIIGSCVVMGGCFACAGLIYNNSKQDWAASNSNSNSTPAKPPTKPAESSVPVTAADKLAQGRKMVESNTAWHDLLRAKEYLSDIPPAVPEYAEAKRLLYQLEPKLRKAEAQEAGALRERLAQSFKQTIAEANPHLNFISSRVTKVKGGYAIWAVHEFFSQYTLSVGDDAKIASAWWPSNYEELRRTYVVQVGFWGSGAFGSRCWLVIP